MGRERNRLHHQADSVAILGVSSQYHDSAAALVVDGEIIAAAQEERFTRVKGDARMPTNAIEYVLREANIPPSSLSAAVFYESPFAKFDRILTTQLTGRLNGLPTFVRAVGTWLPEKLWVARQISDIVGSDVPVIYGDHHLSHAAAAYLPSPFADAAILTVDGVGEWTTTSIGRGIGDTVELLEQIEYPNSLGLLYSAFTLYCGFKINSGEYKLMGLAPYGEARFVDIIMDHLITIDEDGSYSLNPEYFRYLNGTRTYDERFEKLFGAPTRDPEGPLTQHYADVAASIQAVTDTAMLRLAAHAKNRTGSRHLCLAGGVALNVVSVGKIERAGIFDQIWIQPAAGDAGSALGAALWASTAHFGTPRAVSPTDSMRGALLGPTPGAVDVTTATVIEQYGFNVHRLDDALLSARVASLVESGSVVAIARGRMEFGPRALGNRSIIADARDPEMQLRLNLKTKFREGFRPFAPIVLASDASEYFEIGDNDSPYMLKTYYVRPELRHDVPSVPTDAADDRMFYRKAQEVRSTIPAITHVDHSARVQTVDPQRHEFLHSVLTDFKHRTGCAVLVNTSFNVRGEPIVASATDAVECFLHTDIDALVVDDYLIIRAEQTPEALRPRRASARQSD